ncbi:hypothetical protein L7F22_020995 [Adiantum nelumboides]|nr:hypothetical protein [Adiantum nelumboides]
MQREGIAPNAITYKIILKACGTTQDVDIGKRIHDVIIRQGLSGYYWQLDRSETDHCPYTKRAKDGSLMFLILYVDDMSIEGRHMEDISMLKLKMAKYFDMKDMGDASHILGMQIRKDMSKTMLYLSQPEYIDKVLKRSNTENVEALSTPLVSFVKLSLNDSPVSDSNKAKIAKILDASAIGSLMYAMIATRLDIALSLKFLSIMICLQVLFFIKISE